jgi:hypothetical protein
MTYAYDDVAMSQPSALDPFRVATSLTFATREVTMSGDEWGNEFERESVASSVELEGPRGAREFASMWVLYTRNGIMCDRLESILLIRIGGRGRGASNVTAQHQMIRIMRWLLACSGHGEDVLMDAIEASMLDGDNTVGGIMAHAPVAIETIEWARREPPRDSTPIEWLA